MKFDLWTPIPLRLQFRSPLCGGSPRSDKVIEDFVRLRAATPPAHARLEAKPLGPEEKQPKSIDAVTQERLDMIHALAEEEEQLHKMWVGFQKDGPGFLGVRGANFRAHLKDCASVFVPTMKEGRIPGLPKMANFRAKFADSVYVKEDFVRILVDGKPIKEVPEYRDATINAMTAQGRRTCLKRVDMVPNAHVALTVLLLEGVQGITQDHVELCLEYGREHGFGQDRSLQFGRYDYHLGGKQVTDKERGETAIDVEAA